MRVQFQLVFSDIECFVQPQISGVVFACNYLGFNVLGVVMVSYEVTFSWTNCRWSNVLSRDRVGIVLCFQCRTFRKSCA